MKNKPKVVKLPVSYTQDAFDDERFLKLRVKVMHSGLNLNNSSFNMDAINAAQSSLANIPLLAFIKKVDGDDSNSDFAGHEYEIKVTEDDVKYVYLGRPIGIVPESNNYAVEMDAETGKVFVSVDAYVWKDYANSALDILERDSVKKVSMEIIVDDYEWQENYVDIKAYKYTGIALLGEDVREAMIGANAEIVQFSADSITDMLVELKEALSNFSTVEEPVVEAQDSELEVEEDDVEDFSSEENEEEIITDLDLEDDEKTEDEDDTAITEPDVKLDDSETDEFEEELIEPEEEPAIFTPETVETDVTVADLQLQIQEFENIINTLKQENADLKEFKENIEKENIDKQKEELFNSFTDLEEEEIASLKEMNCSLDELEMRLYALRGKKVAMFESKPKAKIDNFYGISTKALNEPIYADLVKKNKKN